MAYRPKFSSFYPTKKTPRQRRMERNRVPIPAVNRAGAFSHSSSHWSETLHPRDESGHFKRVGVGTVSKGKDGIVVGAIVQPHPKLNHSRNPRQVVRSMHGDFAVTSTGKSFHASDLVRAPRRRR
jgi:hypothetical protein